ncbi:MAG: hypothetical protein HOG05_16415 [Bacteroidetes bacterium]|nr:hypothetical protein [Bacteroidota bacterium]
MLHSELQYYDFLSDTPVALDYKRIDTIYEKSKFIYSVRDIEDWLMSCKNFRRFSSDYPAESSILYLRRRLFGTNYFDEDKYRSAYLRHHKDVMDYFKNRRADLLSIDICIGQGWDEICSFLDCCVPNDEFPWLK